jgi:predicted dinucleotide-binding enzyme
MKFGVLGTGVVGTTLAGKLAALGHEVKMGARAAGNEKARQWAQLAGGGASEGSYADAAGFGEIVIHATRGDAAIEVVRAAGRGNLRGKVLVDVSNPLDFSKGMPPTLFTGAAGDSLGERIQKELPETRVVKSLNTINASVMVDPARASADGAVFVAGNDEAAKKEFAGLLEDFGWKNIVDLGDITGARATEAYVLLWLRLWETLKTADFNVEIVRG